MQKQVNFFEQHVQWFALGLGGLFLAWMVFSYVLSPPVKVDVGGKPMGPGEVDPETLRVPVTNLKRDIDKRDIPSIPQRDYVESFLAAIEGVGRERYALSGTQLNFVPPDGIDSDGVVGGDAVVAGVPVEVLPKLPSARPEAFVTGRSTVTYPDPNWEPNPRRPQEQQPMVEADKDWSSLAFRIPGEALAKSFTAAFDEKKLDAAGVDPLQLLQTALVDVEMVRQQIMPGGKVGKEEVVKPLLNSLRPPFPGKNAGEFEIFNYLTFISTNPNDLMFPVFYEVISGDIWAPPSEENERFAAQDRAARIAARKAQQEQMRQQAAARRQMQLQQRMTRGRGGATMPPGAMDFGEGTTYGDMGFEDESLIPGAFGGRPMMPARPGGVRPGMRQPGTPLQGGRFDVETVGDLEIIVHDDTIEAGKTYRYKMRYRLLNPVYKGIRIAKPELTKEFAIESPWSGWSQPVKMRSKIEFFLARLGADKADFDVFEWRDGKMNKDTVSVQPGDAIGKTGWSMVDVRGFGRKGYALVVDETGIMYRRDPEDLNNNPSDRYLELDEQVEMANPPVSVNRPR